VDWRNGAACRDRDPELFFPNGTSSLAIAQLYEAKAVCGTCLVQEACLQWALRSEPIGQEVGVCAGLSEDERRILKPRAARERSARGATAARGGLLKPAPRAAT
jgi:WhiB family transcriptional regulator, redox-sensing transcriptional regulator